VDRRAPARAHDLPAADAGRCPAQEEVHCFGDGDQVTATAPAPAASAPIVHETALIRSWKAPIALGVFALISLVIAFAFPNAGESTFTLSTQYDAIQLPPVVVSTTLA